LLLQDKETDQAENNVAKQTVEATPNENSADGEVAQGLATPINIRGL
jgi:hypothetical protein